VKEFMVTMETRKMGEQATAVTRDTSWKTPAPGWLKANWDASNEKNRMGFGVVVRTKEEKS
jgi:hypothetical protein